jgi:metal-responsive CopG/Arc/MetJ family transcriptional regulator
MMTVKKITIGLDDKVLKNIDELSNKAHRSRSNFIEYALLEYLKFEKKEQIFQQKITELEKQLLIQSMEQNNSQVNITPHPVEQAENKSEKVVVPLKFPLI